MTDKYTHKSKYWKVHKLESPCTNPVELKHTFNNCSLCSHNVFQAKIFGWRTPPHPSTITQSVNGYYNQFISNIMNQVKNRQPRNSNESSEKHVFHILTCKKIIFHVLWRRPHERSWNIINFVFFNIQKSFNLVPKE